MPLGAEGQLGAPASNVYFDVGKFASYGKLRRGAGDDARDVAEEAEAAEVRAPPRRARGVQGRLSPRWPLAPPCPCWKGSLVGDPNSRLPTLFSRPQPPKITVSRPSFCQVPPGYALYPSARVPLQVPMDRAHARAAAARLAWWFRSTRREKAEWRTATPPRAAP